MLAYLMILGIYLLLATSLQCNFEVGLLCNVGVLEFTIFDIAYTQILGCFFAE